MFLRRMKKLVQFFVAHGTSELTCVKNIWTYIIYGTHMGHMIWHIHVRRESTRREKTQVKFFLEQPPT